MRIPVRKKLQRTFGNMRKRAMAQIMNESRQLYEPFVLIRELENVAQQARNVKHTKRVVEAGVQRTWVDHVRHRKLANASEALKHWSLNNVRFVSRQANETVNRIS
jgi:hypothetical protein